MSYIGVILFIAVIAFFLVIIFSGKKLKEYAVYGADGEVLHLWRKQQNMWYEWGGQLIFYEDASGKSRVIIQQHWIKRYRELKVGEWIAMAEAEKKEQEEIKADYKDRY